MLQFKRSISRPRLHRGVFDSSESNLGNQPIAGEDRAYTGVIRPDGSGSIGIRRRKGELSTERKHSRDRKAKLLAVEYLDWDLHPGENNTTRVVRCEVPAKKLSPLTLSEVSIGRTVRRRTAKGLTLRGKRTIQSGCKLLEKRYGVKNLGFYTLTCPFTKTSEVEIFNERFPDIIKRFLERVRRVYSRLGAKFPYVGCHEVQTARAKRTGIHALHFHFISPCKLAGGKGFILSSAEIRDIYEGCILNVTGFNPGGITRVGTEVCRKSSGAYLAKYMSKGGDGDMPVPGHNSYPRLSSWYVCSRCVLHVIRATTYTPSGADIDNVHLRASGASDTGDIVYAKPVKRLICGFNRVVGYVFTVSKDRVEKWLNFCKPVIWEYI